MKKLVLCLAILSVSHLASAATTVGSKAEKLQDLMGKVARNDSAEVKKGDPIDMIKEYIVAKNDKDPNALKGYKFVEDSSSLEVDTAVAGTITYKTALLAVSDLEGFSKKQLAYAKALIKEIHDAGGLFGFDGFEQNACAAPTAFLLIIDTKGGEVYGVDLSPCSES